MCLFTTRGGPISKMKQRIVNIWDNWFLQYFSYTCIYICVRKEIGLYRNTWVHRLQTERIHRQRSRRDC